MSNKDQDFEHVTDKLGFTDEEKDNLYHIIAPILVHEQWSLMKNNKHHLHSRAIHCLEVCCQAWQKAYKLKSYDEKAVAIGGLLHDFFFYDWQNEKIDISNLTLDRKMIGPKNHGFMHPLIALENAYKYFPELVNDKVEDIIIKHMWPLTVKPPKYRESMLVCYIDKSCSLNIIKSPKELPRYLGVKKRNKNGIKLL